MKLTQLIAFFLLGALIVGIGTTFKIMHWPFANILFVAGGLIKVISGFFIIIKFISSHSLKELFDEKSKSTTLD